MDSRSRKNQLKIYLNDEELELFKRKMKFAKCKSMAHFIRKCVMEKEIYHVDLEPFREIQWLLCLYDKLFNLCCIYCGSSD